jgi:hypothetical protein
MDNLSKIQIDMYVSLFSQQMNFTNKKQQYNFKTKMNNYAKKQEFNLTYELFKLCIKQQQQLENRPVIQAEKVIEKTEKEILLDYQEQIENIPVKYKKATQMEEFHNVVDKLETYLCDIEPQEENEELVEDLTNILDDNKNKVIENFSVPIDDWTYWGSKLKKNILIYSPQSYQGYLESMENFIKHNDGVPRMRMSNFKNEYLQNKELKQLLRSFKG